MSRIKDLQKQVHRVLEKMEDGDKRLKAISHLHGVALAAELIDSGAALNVLEKVIEVSNRPEVEA